MRATKQRVVVPPGLVVVDKPDGMTSHDVVARVRRIMGTRKVGHAGTLDPMATGVLVLGIERATKLLGHLALDTKAYLATIRLGSSTTTDDAQGETLSTSDASGVADEAITAGIAKLTGHIQQVPSAVSAVKVDGKRAYARVRAGEQVELAAARWRCPGSTCSHPPRGRRARAGRDGGVQLRHVRPRAGQGPGRRTSASAATWPHCAAPASARSTCGWSRRWRSSPSSRRCRCRWTRRWPPRSRATTCPAAGQVAAAGPATAGGGHRGHLRRVRPGRPGDRTRRGRGPAARSVVVLITHDPTEGGENPTLNWVVYRSVRAAGLRQDFLYDKETLPSQHDRRRVRPPAMRRRPYSRPAVAAAERLVGHRLHPRHGDRPGHGPGATRTSQCSSAATGSPTSAGTSGGRRHGGRPAGQVPHPRPRRHAHARTGRRHRHGLYVANGVTTVREMAGSPLASDWRTRIEAGTLLGPRYTVGSRMIDGSPTIWNPEWVDIVQVGDPASARAAVREEIARGADFIKVYSRVPGTHTERWQRSPTATTCRSRATARTGCRSKRPPTWARPASSTCSGPRSRPRAGGRGSGRRSSASAWSSATTRAGSRQCTRWSGRRRTPQPGEGPRLYSQARPPPHPPGPDTGHAPGPGLRPHGRHGTDPRNKYLPGSALAEPATGGQEFDLKDRAPAEDAEWAAMFESACAR